MRLTLAQAKASRIPQSIGLLPTDSAFVAILNEATQRLLSRGKWVGTYGVYQITTSNGLLTWPRQLETIETLSISNYPVELRNQWFEFLSNGPLLQADLSSNSAGFTYDWQAYDRGNTCTFASITGLVSKVRVYTDVAEAAGSKILLLGYDQNNNWIRTQVGGVWQDGEYVVLTAGAGAHTDSTNLFTKLTAVQKPATSGFVRLYAYDTVALTQTAIAVYEPSDTNCSFRCTYVSQIASTATANVTVMGKFAFIPVAVDTDYLLIGNIPALKEMCRAIRYAEMDTGEAAQLAGLCEGRAINEVQNELNSWMGDGATQSLNVQHYPAGYTPVESLV